MNAGLPGTGIGGLFYIASALVMPVHRLVRGGGHEGRSWRRVGVQVTIAASILGMLFLAGWALGLLFAPVLAPQGQSGLAGYAAPNLVRRAAVLGTVGLLAVVLLAVEMARLLLPRRGAGVAPAGARSERTAADPGGPRGRRKRSHRRRRISAVPSGKVREVA